VLCECVVCSYQGPTDVAVCSWRMFCIRLPPAFLTEWATTSFGRCSYPGQIKYVIVMWRYFPSYQLTANSVLEWVLAELLHWLCSSTWLATHFNRLGMPWIFLVRIYQGGALLGEISDTRWTVTAHYTQCCCHMEQQWTHTEYNTRWFEMSTVLHSQCRK
jgi:hypothetical protein